MGHKAADQGASVPPPPDKGTTAAAGLSKAEVEALLKSAIDKVTHDADAKIGPLRQELADARRRVAHLETAPKTNAHHHDDEKESHMSDATTARNDHNTDSNPQRIELVLRDERGASTTTVPAEDKKSWLSELMGEYKTSRARWTGFAIVLVVMLGIIAIVWGIHGALKNEAPEPQPLTAEQVAKIVADTVKVNSPPPVPAPVVAPPPPAPTPMSTLPRCLPNCLDLCVARYGGMGVDDGEIRTACASIDCAQGVGCQ